MIVELPAEPQDQPGAIEVPLRRELEEAGRLDTALGQTCLALARRLDNPRLDTGSAIAAMAARLDDLRTKATKGTGSTTAPQQLRDELALRRTRHA